jgi:transposase
LHDRSAALFGAKFDVLLYDLTRTNFESDPPFPADDKRQFGYSRDKRSDCVLVVIALIITPEGLPLTYEVLSGNTADKTTLRDFLLKKNKKNKKNREPIRQGRSDLAHGKKFVCSAAILKCACTQIFSGRGAVLFR